LIIRSLMEVCVRKRKLILPAWGAAAALLLAGCGSLDVVGKTAITTFAAFLDAVPGRVALDSAAGRWVYSSPGGEKFEWSTDFSAAPPNFRVSLDAAPFLAAGLEPGILPKERYDFDAASGRLSLSFDIGKDRYSYEGAATPLETFRKIVGTHRPMVGYHAALDHYGIALGDGNMFEWAKDMAKNDKDAVFVLNPEPLRAAGVDPAKVTGWLFAKIPVQDKSGKTVNVDKFVKPYNLK
jgi:hypothetical protein